MGIMQLAFHLGYVDKAHWSAQWTIAYLDSTALCIPTSTSSQSNQYVHLAFSSSAVLPHQMFIIFWEPALQNQGPT